jgi:phosphotriesterase-related protein
MAGMLPLIEAGYAAQLTMGHDVFTKSATRRGGGEGFLRIPRFIVPTLRRSGVSDEDIDQITVENPRRLLAY